MRQRKNIINIAVGVITLLLLLSFTGCGDEWMSTKLTVKPREQLRRGDNTSKVPIDMFVGMHMFFVSDTVGWRVDSYEEAVQGLIRKTDEVSGDEQKEADQGPSYKEPGAFVFSEVSHPMVMLVGYDIRQKVYGWRGLKIVQNLSNLQIEFVIRSTDWNNNSTYTQDRWTMIDNEVPPVVPEPEPEPDEPNPDNPE